MGSRGFLPLDCRFCVLTCGNCGIQEVAYVVFIYLSSTKDHSLITKGAEFSVRHKSYITFHQFYTISTGYQSSHKLSTDCWALPIRSYREWHQFISSNVWTIFCCPKRTRSTNKTLFIKRTKANYGDRSFSFCSTSQTHATELNE
jgi:hypothetical protein